MYRVKSRFGSFLFSLSSSAIGPVWRYVRAQGHRLTHLKSVLPQTEKECKEANAEHAKQMQSAEAGEFGAGVADTGMDEGFILSVIATRSAARPNFNVRKFCVASSVVPLRTSNSKIRTADVKSTIGSEKSQIPTEFRHELRQSDLSVGFIWIIEVRLGGGRKRSDCER